MKGEFVFLNKNSYNKDGQRKCYASFVDISGGIINFNGAAIPDSAYPDAFSVCNLEFDVQQYSNNSTSFILQKCDVVGVMKVAKN